MEKVTREIAEREINEWLAYKKINDAKREAYKEHIETLIGAVMDGSIVVNEEKTFLHELKFALEGEIPVTRLEYKPRVKISTIHRNLQGVKSDDVDGRICGYIAALSSKPRKVIEAIDTEDYSISKAVAIFFL